MVAMDKAQTIEYLRNKIMNPRDGDVYHRNTNFSWPVSGLELYREALRQPDCRAPDATSYREWDEEEDNRPDDFEEQHAGGETEPPLQLRYRPWALRTELAVRRQRDGRSRDKLPAALVYGL